MRTPCPLCGGERLRCVFHEAGRELLACRACGAAHVSPPPSEGRQRSVADEAAALRLPREKREEVLRVIRAHNAEILGYLERNGPRGRLLDVGCGRGILMEDASRRGWGATGVEPARSVAEEGVRERRLDIRIGTLEDAGLPGASFDAVVFSHSLEHLRDPAATMREAARLLKPGGWAYVETPHWGSLSRRLLGRRWWNVDLDNHLFYFTPRAVAAVGGRAGLELRESWGTHFDALAVLIRLAGPRGDARNDLDSINACRDRVLSVRGAWRATRLLETVAGACLGRSRWNDYLVCWLRKPAP